MLRSLRVLPLLACLALFACPAGAAAATAAFPTVSKVSPLRAGVGDTLVLSGRNYRSGLRRNTVVFKSSGRRPVFVRAGRSTSKRLSVKLPSALLRSLAQKSGKPVATRFQVRVLAKRFGKRYTTLKRSPVIGPISLGPKVTVNDCDGDGLPNSRDADDDNDLLSDVTEAVIKTDPCNRDTDGDGLSDGWEQESALDYNGRATPTPLKRPYPNALDPKDAGVDSDGDGMTNAQEYLAWALFGGDKLPLSYSGGDPATGGKNRPTAGMEFADRDLNGFLSDNERDADGDGLPNQEEDLIDGFPDPRLPPLDARGRPLGMFSERFIVAPEVHAVIDEVPLYGALAHTRKVLSLNWLDRDSDGDTISDGADDQDGDEISNRDELVTEVSSSEPVSYLPINPCSPNLDARLCIVGDDDIDKDGIPNRADDDDDGDLLSDVDERRYKTNPFKADTDGDGATDGYEFFAAKDLNGAALPFPGKQPYPNPLDKDDGAIDHDGDGLSLLQEFKAWRYTGSPLPLSYSDGKQRSDDGELDSFRDVDGDGASNYAESSGPLSGPEWWAAYSKSSRTALGCAMGYVETPYPGPKFQGLNFVDPDTDGDGILDGADDIDHDGLSNAVEGQRRVSNWCDVYVSVGPPPLGDGQPTGHAGTSPGARIDPFNPCKPFNSNACHKFEPNNYYVRTDAYTEDWQGPPPPG